MVLGRLSSIDGGAGARRSPRGRRPATLAALIASSLLAPGLAEAGSGPDPCLSATVAEASAPETRIRFGITPQLAGTVGAEQGSVVAEDPARRRDALRALRPPHRAVVIRLNRLFMADGDAGIERFAARARRYARAGFAVESQVRYHPAPGQQGDIGAWRRFVRRAARALGANRALVSLTITNEVNLPLSANTSDGAFPGAIEAIVRGVPSARRALDRIGREDVELGFSYAYRYLPSSDTEFWQSIGERAGPRFAAALDYVGVQLYPGLFWPPALITETAGEATIEALALVRDCWMPQAGLGDEVEVWVSENGYSSNSRRPDERQAAELADTLAAVRAYSGTLGVRDYRYFNLRDNRPDGADIFDNVGLLRADYSRKPAYAVYRDAIERWGARR